MNRYWRKATKTFYDAQFWRTFTYRGILIGKIPLDLWIYQEIIERVRPEVIIELGTCRGGSALWFHDQLQANGGRLVVSVDCRSIHSRGWARRDGIQYLTGMSTSQAIYDELARIAGAASGPVMVSADSNHSYRNVRRELHLYSPLVTVGSYYVVEDGILDHILARPKMGAWQAATEFCAANKDFVLDEHCERMGITFHVGGWLKRVSHTTVQPAPRPASPAAV